jgi:asparagine synthase (glutamine-hydrolysing)
MFRVFKNLKNTDFKKRTACSFKVGDFVVDVFEKKQDLQIYETKEFYVLFEGYVVNCANAAQAVLEGYLKNRLEKVNGVFCAVVIDKLRNRLILLCDRFGLRPLYLFNQENYIIVSDRLDLMVNTRKSFSINWSSWADFFAFGYILGAKTYFAEIERLFGGRLIFFEKDRKKSEKIYWDYRKVKTIEKNDEQTVTEFKEIIKSVTLDFVRSLKDKVIVNLSGGFDSRLILASLVKFGNLLPVTFTTEKYPEDKEDLKKAKQISETLGCQNFSFRLERNLFKKYLKKKYELIDYATNYHLWLMPLLAKYPKDSVNFDGFIGDMLLGGTFQDGFGASRLFSELFLFDKKLNKVFKSVDICCESKNNFLREYERFRVYCNSAFYFRLANRIRNSTAFYVFGLLEEKVKERLFFLDSRIIDFCLSLPPEKKKNHYIYNKIMQKIFPEVFAQRAHSNFKQKIIMKVKDFMFSFLPFRPLAFTLKRKMLYRFKKEDVDYLTNEALKINLPQFFDQGRLADFIKRCKIDNSLCYHLEQILAFSWWYQKYKRFLMS